MPGHEFPESLSFFFLLLASVLFWSPHTSHFLPLSASPSLWLVSETQKHQNNNNKNNGQYTKLCTWKLIHTKQQQKRTATVANIKLCIWKPLSRQQQKQQQQQRPIHKFCTWKLLQTLCCMLFVHACCSRLCTEFWNPGSLMHWFSLPTESSSSVQSLVVILCQVTHPLLSQVASWSFPWVQQEGPYSKFTISGVGQRWSGKQVETLDLLNGVMSWFKTMFLWNVYIATHMHVQ